jgi:hypothetical protein
VKRFLTILLLAVQFPLLSWAVTKNKVIQENNFSKGVDTYHNPQSLPEGYSQDSQNVFYDLQAPVQKRLGYAFSWGVNQTTGSYISIYQGINDQFQIRDRGIGYPVKVLAGSYLPSVLASLLTSEIASQTIWRDTFTYSSPYFVFQSTIGFGHGIGFLGTRVPQVFGQTIGFTPNIVYLTGGSGPVYVSTAPQTPVFNVVGPSFQGLWTYTDPTNTTWQIARSSSQITANNLSGTTVVVATVSANNVVGETNAFGKAFFVDQTQGVYYWNGSSITYEANSPLGSIITTFHGRVWVTGLAVPNGNQIYGSTYNDAISANAWNTAQAGLPVTEAVLYFVGLNDNFDNITAEYVYLDTLYIFKHSSIFALYGFDQSSFQISQLTQECGCIDGNTIQTWNSALEFVSLRGVEAFNGYTCTRISDAVKNKIDPAISVRGYTAQSWVQSQTTDWQAGTLTNLSATVAAPALVLSTQTAFSQTDNNWNAGTIYGDIKIIGNTLAFNTFGGISQSAGTGSFIAYEMGGNTGVNAWAQAIDPNPGGASGKSGTLTSLTVEATNGGPFGAGSLTVSVYNDSGGSPGSALWTSSTLTPTIALPSYQAFTLYPTCNLTTGNRYWVVFTLVSGIVNIPYVTGLSFGGYGATTVQYSPPSWTSWFEPNQNPNTSTFQMQFTWQQSAQTGSFTSQVFNIGYSTGPYFWNWGTFNTSETDNGQTIAYMTQVSSTSSGPWDTPVAVTPGGLIGSATKPYIQYIASFTTTNTSVTPVLSSVTLNTSVITSSLGSFQSQVWNIGTPIYFGNFSVSDMLNGGNIAFSICSSSNYVMVPESCVNQNPNSQILVGTNTYVQWYATFTVTAATQTPTLNSGTVQWYTGSNQNPMASTVWDNRYWLALTTNSVDTANDAVLVLNKNGAWSPLNIHAGAFTQTKNNLYHADSTLTGSIYLDNQGESDNGVPINAYVRTRAFSFGDLAADDYLYALYPSAVNTGNCSMTMSYELDQTGTFYPLGTVNLNEYNAYSAVRVPFPITSANQDFGQTFDAIIGTDDAQCDFQLYGVSILYKERPVY